MRPTPVDELQHLHMDPPGPVPATCRGITLAAFPEAAVDAIVDGFGPALVGIQVMHAGGKLTGLGDPFQVFAVGIGAHADLDALETALGVLVSWLVEPGVLSYAQLVDRMACAPARIFGLPGGTP